MKLASEAGVDAITCRDVAEATRHLNDSRSYALLIVANQIGNNGDGVNLIRTTRLFANRAAMPIVFVMTDRNLALAHVAMQAGATEVLLRADRTLLGSFISEAANPLPAPVRTGRALVVEDNRSQAAYFEQMCLALGFGVDRSTSMEGGVEFLRNGSYQIAIIDIVLEGVNSGLALIRHIRQLPPPRSLLPILVVSGFDDAARRIEALRLGADDFLSKPVAEEEFVWRLQRIIQLRAASSPETFGTPAPDQLAWQQHGLSLREGEICDALMKGANDKQIASDLRISFWTVRTHIGRIFAKLSVLNRRELMARYLPASGR